MNGGQHPQGNDQGIELEIAHEKANQGAKGHGHGEHGWNAQKRAQFVMQVEDDDC